MFRALDIELQELDDWNCCGATSYMSIDEMKAFALAARNLALAEEQSPTETPQILAPCAACYLVLCKTQHNIAESPEIHQPHRRRPARSEAGLPGARAGAAPAGYLY